jgi:glucose/arabinose dehydrogenase
MKHAVAAAALVASTLTGLVLLVGAPAGNVPEDSERIRLELVAGGLEAPVDVQAAPGDARSLYVAEQTGRVMVVRDGAVRPRPFLDLTRRVRADGERGLLGIAFHPDYAVNRLMYAHFTDRRGDTRLIEVRTDGIRVLPGTERELFSVRQPYENHNGGQIAFAPDGRLVLGLGDGGSAFDPERRAQNLGVPFGKLLAFDVSRPEGKPEILAYGLRNPWRFDWDADGNLFVGDVGQDAWEEIDVLPVGEPGLVNFGWDAFEGHEPVEDAPLSPEGRVAAPIAVYPHGEECSVTVGRVYHGDLVPALRGRLLFGDYCSGRIWSLHWLGGENADVREEPVRLPTVTSFGEGPDGELYVTAQSGALFRLTFVP